MTKTILIVEDDDSLRNILCEKLEKERFVILKAKNGQEGLEMALAKRPDLILLDIIMPVMDGLTMANKLREVEGKTDQMSQGRTPIIFLTNLSDEKALSSGQQAGVYDYLVKTAWTLDGIVKKVKDKLGE